MRHEHAPFGTVFFSRKNKVALTQFRGQAAVEKTFSSPADAHRECEYYRLFIQAGINVPELIAHFDGKVYVKYIPGMTGLDLLEQSERIWATTGQADLTPWLQLTEWCCVFYSKSGLCLGDPNLRNFIFDHASLRWYGFDFECCHTGTPAEDFAQLLAFITLYSPENTSFKKHIVSEMSRYFSRITGFPHSELEMLQWAAAERLRLRRRSQHDLIGPATAT